VAVGTSCLALQRFLDSGANENARHQRNRFRPGDLMCEAVARCGTSSFSSNADSEVQLLLTFVGVLSQDVGVTERHPRLCALTTPQGASNAGESFSSRREGHGQSSDGQYEPGIPSRSPSFGRNSR